MNSIHYKSSNKTKDTTFSQYSLGDKNLDIRDMISLIGSTLHCGLLEPGPYHISHTLQFSKTNFQNSHHHRNYLLASPLMQANDDITN